MPAGIDDLKEAAVAGAVLTVATYTFMKDASDAVSKSFHRFQDRATLELIEHIEEIRREECSDIFNPITKKLTSFEPIFQAAPKGDTKGIKDEKSNSESKDIPIPRQAVSLSPEILSAIKKLIKPLDTELNGYYEHLLYAANAISSFDNFRLLYGERKSHQNISAKFKNIFKKDPSRSDPISATNQWLIIAMQLHCDPAQGVEFTIDVLNHLHDFITQYAELHGGPGSTLYNFMMQTQKHMNSARKILEDYTKKNSLEVKLPPFVAACRAESDNLLKLCMKLIPTLMTRRGNAKKLVFGDQVDQLPPNESWPLIDNAELPDIAKGIIRPKLADDTFDHGGHLSKTIRLPKLDLPFLCEWIQTNAQDQLEMIHFLTKNQNRELVITKNRFSYEPPTDDKALRKHYKKLREVFFNKNEALLTRKVTNPGHESLIKELTLLTDDEIHINILRFKELCELNYQINLVQYFSRKLYENYPRIRAAYNDEDEALIAEVIFKTVDGLKSVFSTQHKRALEAYEAIEETVSDGPLDKEHKLLLALIRDCLIGTSSVNNVICSNLDEMLNHHREMQQLHSDRRNRPVRQLIDQALDPSASEILKLCETITVTFDLDAQRHFRRNSRSEIHAAEEKSNPNSPPESPRGNNLPGHLLINQPPAPILPPQEKTTEDYLEIIQANILRETNPAYKKLYLSLIKMKADAQDMINHERNKPHRYKKGLHMEKIAHELSKHCSDYLELSLNAKAANYKPFTTKIKNIFDGYRDNNYDFAVDNELIDHHENKILKILKDIFLSIVTLLTQKKRVGGSLFETTSRENINNFRNHLREVATSARIAAA